MDTQNNLTYTKLKCNIVKAMADIKHAGTLMCEMAKIDDECDVIRICNPDNIDMVGDALSLCNISVITEKEFYAADTDGGLRELAGKINV